MPLKKSVKYKTHSSYASDSAAPVWNETSVPIVGPHTRYVNPYTDFGFKRLFGEPASKDLLINFLGTLIKDQGKIKDITYLNPEKLGKTVLDRKAFLDIYCENEKGEKFIVEMQQVSYPFFKDRSVYYSTFPIQDQAIKGRIKDADGKDVSWNFELKAVYFVGILDFVFDEDRGKKKCDYYTEVKLMDTDTKDIFYDKLTYIYLEMPNFKKTEDELETMFDKWLYALKSLPTLRTRPKILSEYVFKKMFKLAEVAAFTTEEIRRYNASVKAQMDWDMLLYTKQAEAEAKGLAKGLEEGKAKGLAEGKAKGLAEGKAKGLAEGETKTLQNMIINMQTTGFTIGQIMKATKLSKAELVKLVKNISH